MLIQHEEKENGGTFYIPEHGGNVAEMTYVRHDPKTMIIDHTEVDPKLRGKTIGYQLVESAVEYARAHKLKIRPVCVFARAVFDKKPEFGDVLKEQE
ncbi:MAG: N-acetyltransferase [Chitinophagaceae bacterium]|nr:MAG: N-acetyltransferase [Chitinophagaceae bacterium]